jgi:hypothetical protein
MSSAAGKMVNVEHRDEVAVVKMNRAPVNSLNMELMTELREAIAACESMRGLLQNMAIADEGPPGKVINVPTFTIHICAIDVAAVDLQLVFTRAIVASQRLLFSVLLSTGDTYCNRRRQEHQGAGLGVRRAAYLLGGARYYGNVPAEGRAPGAVLDESPGPVAGSLRIQAPYRGVHYRRGMLPRWAIQTNHAGHGTYNTRVCLRLRSLPRAAASWPSHATTGMGSHALALKRFSSTDGSTKVKKAGCMVKSQNARRGAGRCLVLWRVGGGNPC